jgi:hypothetical protein
MPLSVYQVERVEHMLLRDPVLRQKLGPKVCLTGRFEASYFHSLSVRVALDLESACPRGYWRLADILRSGWQHQRSNNLAVCKLYAMRLQRKVEARKRAVAERHECIQQRRLAKQQIRAGNLSEQARLKSVRLAKIVNRKRQKQAQKLEYRKRYETEQRRLKQAIKDGNGKIAGHDGCCTLIITDKGKAYSVRGNGRAAPRAFPVKILLRWMKRLFLPPKPYWYTIQFKNGNPENIAASNLRQVPYAYEDVAKVLESVRSGMKAPTAAAKYNMRFSHIIAFANSNTAVKRLLHRHRQLAYRSRLAYIAAWSAKQGPDYNRRHAWRSAHAKDSALAFFKLNRERQQISKHCYAPKLCQNNPSKQPQAVHQAASQL